MKYHNVCADEVLVVVHCLLLPRGGEWWGRGCSVQPPLLLQRLSGVDSCGEQNQRESTAGAPWTDAGRRRRAPYGDRGLWGFGGGFMDFSRGGQGFFLVKKHFFCIFP